MGEEIVVNIGPEGETTIDAQGFKGKTCAEATEFLEKGLGAVAKSTKKAEFMQKAPQVKNQIRTKR